MEDQLRIGQAGVIQKVVHYPREACCAAAVLVGVELRKQPVRALVPSLGDQVEKVCFDEDRMQGDVALGARGLYPLG
ncbi:hypothetical protein GCM10022268_28770 [Sphingomonas cynarae]|uniref:Uncharacterized protein n=1 Tax=Sphingomonas cynarae TaxID=930197 RepID=A0ABP7EHP2_9SPHN